MKIDISHVPSSPGVYFFKDSAGIILYIGKAKNLKKRVAQYFAPGSLRKQEMLQKAISLDFLVVKTESESLYLENNLIKKHKPFYNNMLKGGNGYSYIKLTYHDFPQILTTRMKKRDKATYIGPKHNTRELKKLLQYVRNLLQYRTCSNSQFNQGKLCSEYYFYLCKGRCAGCPLHEDMKNIKSFEQMKIEYKQILQLFSSFFKGNTKPVEKELLKQIDIAVHTENYEWAAKLRDIYLQIEQFVEKQHVELPKNISGYVVGLRKIGEWNVYVVLHFFEGKLIDVIRDKRPSEDGDFYWMLAGFEAELGDMQIQIASESSFLAWSTGLVFLKSEQEALETMLHGFFDSYVITASFEGENFHNDLLQILQERYGFKNFPYHIECVDISHLSGGWISGGLTCMIGGLIEKKGYRKYKIKSVKDDSDDYLSLKEVIERRFLKQNIDLRENFPDVCILDGGKGQLGVVKKLYEEQEKFRKIFDQVQFVALGKGEARKKSAIGGRSFRGNSEIVGERIYRFDDNFHIVEIPLVYDQADRFLVKLRDEAHRFSNVYRKQQMKKELKPPKK